MRKGTRPSSPPGKGRRVLSILEVRFARSWLAALALIVACDSKPHEQQRASVAQEVQAVAPAPAPPVDPRVARCERMGLPLSAGSVRAIALGPEAAPAQLLATVPVEHRLTGGITRLGEDFV